MKLLSVAAKILRWLLILALLASFGTAAIGLGLVFGVFWLSLSRFSRK